MEVTADINNFCDSEPYYVREVKIMYQLLTHNDLDGVGCGILAKLAFREKVNVRYNSIASLNREIEHFLEEGEKKYFC